MENKKKKNKLSNKIIEKSKKDFFKTFKLLKLAYPHAKCSLNSKNAWQLLVATILSAQCTDKRVNMVTPLLFAKYKTVEDFAKVSKSDVEKLIRSTGFYKNKTKNIIGSAQKIVKNFKSEVPNQMDQLLSLPGVARKTANVVLWNAFRKNKGIVVDTHVKRISFRLGWTNQLDPNKIEKDLMILVPQREWGMLSHYIIDLGRDVCKAKNPNCVACQLSKACPWYKEIIS